MLFPLTGTEIAVNGNTSNTLTGTGIGTEILKKTGTKLERKYKERERNDNGNSTCPKNFITIISHLTMSHTCGGAWAIHKRSVFISMPTAMCSLFSLLITEFTYLDT